MKKPKHHVFMCGSFRANGTPQGVCDKKNSMQLLQYLVQELSDRGMTDVSVSSTGCLKLCDAGPVMVVYPQNWWYGHVESEAVIDEIIDALEEEKPAMSYVI
jgi:(2Fe-2S) ferredoxin